MSEMRRTAVFAAVALAFLMLAWGTAPRVSVPEVFADRGELLFPEFRDPNAAAFASFSGRPSPSPTCHHRKAAPTR